MLEYSCRHCGSSLSGAFGEKVYCEECDMTFETDYDYTEEGSIVCWITGAETWGDNREEK